MILDDFEEWMRKNPARWRQIPDPFGIHGETKISIPLLPALYQQFLNRVGPIELLGVLLVGTKHILLLTEHLRTHNIPEGEISFDHLTPFGEVQADGLLLCFDGERVVLFDPSEFEPDPLASSFDEWLQRFVESEGKALS